MMDGHNELFERPQEGRKPKGSKWAGRSLVDTPRSDIFGRLIHFNFEITSRQDDVRSHYAGANFATHWPVNFSPFAEPSMYPPIDDALVQLRMELAFRFYFVVRFSVIRFICSHLCLQRSFL